MPTAIIDHRATAAVEAAPADDSDRLEKRRGIRKKIAARDSLMERSKVFQDRVRQYDAEADAAADTHREVCGPAQAELKNLDEQIIDLSADRQPIPNDLEKRRRELLQIIDSENVKLSDAVDRVNRLREPVMRDVRQLSVALGEFATCENDLVAAGHPALLAEKFVASKSAEWAGARLRSAQKFLTDAEGLADQALLRGKGYESDAALYEARAANWRPEILAAKRAVAEAERECQAVRKKLLEE